MLCSFLLSVVVSELILPTFMILLIINYLSKVHNNQFMNVVNSNSANSDQASTLQVIPVPLSSVFRSIVNRRSNFDVTKVLNQFTFDQECRRIVPRQEPSEAQHQIALYQLETAKPYDNLAPLSYDFRSVIHGDDNIRHDCQEDNPIVSDMPRINNPVDGTSDRCEETLYDCLKDYTCSTAEESLNKFYCRQKDKLPIELAMLSQFRSGHKKITSLKLQYHLRQLYHQVTKPSIVQHELQDLRRVKLVSNTTVHCY